MDKNSKNSFDCLTAFIGLGRENAIHLRELIRLTGMADRELRKFIEYARRSGICIASGNEGYFFPATLEEVRRFRMREEHRAKSIFYTLRAARELEKRLTVAQDGETIEL